MAQTRSAALGSVLGAFIGDALGSFIEFESSISPGRLQATMLMSGGGPFSLGPGQVTDDSELAMCMLRGLLAGQGKLNLDQVASYYGRWVATGPFDIGVTTRTALGPLAAHPSSAETCIRAAIAGTGSSQSNGSLMRITPLGVWAHRLSPEKAAIAAKLESSMTHSNETIQHAAACYTIAIGHLLRSFGDRQGAYDLAKTYATQSGNGDIRGWFRNIEEEPPMTGTPKMGWAKIGFTHAFRQLLSGQSYVDSISQTLALGGDTDTNAAIVGGLVGAAVGFEALPADYVQKVTTYQYETMGGRSRPEFLDQTVVVQQVEELLQLAPAATTAIVGGQESVI